MAKPSSRPPSNTGVNQRAHASGMAGKYHTPHPSKQLSGWAGKVNSTSGKLC